MNRLKLGDGVVQQVDDPISMKRIITLIIPYKDIQDNSEQYPPNGTDVSVILEWEDDKTPTDK